MQRHLLTAVRVGVKKVCEGGGAGRSFLVYIYVGEIIYVLYTRTPTFLIFYRLAAKSRFILTPSPLILYKKVLNLFSTVLFSQLLSSLPGEPGAAEIPGDIEIYSRDIAGDIEIYSRDIPGDIEIYSRDTWRYRDIQ